MGIRNCTFFLMLLVAFASNCKSMEDDIRLHADDKTALKAIIGKKLHVITLRVYTDLDCEGLKSKYRFSVLISSNERLDGFIETLTLEDKSRFMMQCDQYVSNNNQYYQVAVKFEKVSSRDFGHYTICACPVGPDGSESDSYCDTSECEILGFDFVDETESTCSNIDVSSGCSYRRLGYSSVKHHISDTLETISEMVRFTDRKFPEASHYIFKDMEAGCRILIETAPCFIAFPKCKRLENDTVELKHLCKQDCLDIFDVCKKWLENAKGEAIFKQFASNMSKVLEKLHLGREFDKTLCQHYNDSECISIDATVLKKKTELQNHTSECYDIADKGTSYRGKASTTVSKRQCMSWSMTKDYGDLSSFLRSTIKYAELYTANNYCRNPINVTTLSVDQRKPWCFIDGDNWEFCDVPTCMSLSINPNKVGIINFAFEHFASPVTFFILGLLVFILLALSLVIFFVFRQKCKGKSFPNQQMFRDVNSSPQPRAFYSQDETGLRHFDRSQIETLSKIGQGEFGVVYKAQIKTCDLNAVMMVAVKALREDASNTEQKQFRSEAKLMNEFNHDNIVKFCGVCFEGEPLYMIFEYMPNGDLHDFLRKRAPSVLSSDEGRGASNIVIDKIRQDLSQFLSISVQIAKGLAYLAEQQYVHRDIAARNVLLGDYGKDNILPVKLSDFGLSRSVYARDYYRIKSKSLLPVRWMPPEAITYTTFTAASDVYSFGVVLWEIFSFGTQPYENVSNEEVVAHILKPELLKQPIGCPDSMYEVMKQCWNYHSQQRPSAQELIDKLQREANNCRFMSPRTSHRQHPFQQSNCYNNAQAIAKHEQRRMNSRGGLLKTVPPHRVESNGNNAEMAYPPNHMSLRAPHATPGGTRGSHLSSSIPHLQQGPPMFSMSSRLPGTFPPQFQSSNQVEQFNINENAGYFGGGPAPTQKPFAPKRSMNNDNFESSTLRPPMHPPSRFTPQPRAPTSISRFHMPQSMPVSAGGHAPPPNALLSSGRSMKRSNLMVNNNAGAPGVIMDMNKFSAC